MEPLEPDQEELRSNLSSLTRLAIGGLIGGYDILMKRLTSWEDKLDQMDAVPSNYPEDISQIDYGVQTDDRFEGETDFDRMRYAAIGMIFNSQKTLHKSLKTADRLSRLAGGVLETLVGPIYSSRALSPLRSTVDRLAEHGQRQVDQWIANGRKEEARGRILAASALTDQVDSSIQYLTSNDEVQELIQSQSVGLVGAIVEETREHAVSADNFLEAWVRTMLRRPMRSELPGPSQEIRARAIPYRRIHGKIVRK